MEGSSEEEEGEEERERLKCVAVTSEDLFSSHEAKKGPRGRQATSNDVLARRLQQWVERYSISLSPFLHISQFSCCIIDHSIWEVVGYIRNA